MDSLEEVFPDCQQNTGMPAEPLLLMVLNAKPLLNDAFAHCGNQDDYNRLLDNLKANLQFINDQGKALQLGFNQIKETLKQDFMESCGLEDKTAVGKRLDKNPKLTFSNSFGDQIKDLLVGKLDAKGAAEQLETGLRKTFKTMHDVRSKVDTWNLHPSIRDNMVLYNICDELSIKGEFAEILESIAHDPRMENAERYINKLLTADSKEAVKTAFKALDTDFTNLIQEHFAGKNTQIGAAEKGFIAKVLTGKFLQIPLPERFDSSMSLDTIDEIVSGFFDESTAGVCLAFQDFLYAMRQ